MRTNYIDPASVEEVLQELQQFVLELIALLRFRNMQEQVVRWNLQLMDNHNNYCQYNNIFNSC
jgi:hypothetical protein